MVKYIMVWLAFLSAVVASAKSLTVELYPDSLGEGSELYVYPADKPGGVAILMCPSGGYEWLSIDKEGKDMARWMNSLGITYAVVKYRMPHERSTVPLEDVTKAMRLMREKSDEWGVRTLGIMGASAGGHLAATASTHYESAADRPDFQILFYPVISMDSAITHEGSRVNLLGRNPSEEKVRYYSNETQVTKETPKAFIMLAADDDIVPVANTMRYVRALLDNNVKVSLHMYPDGGHGWGFSDGFRYKRQWTEELEKWLREEVK